jgi:hypothetical protein
MLLSQFSLVRGYSIIMSPYDEMYDKVDSADVPLNISEQHGIEGRFKYVINRDGDDAGMEDVGKANFSHSVLILRAKQVGIEVLNGRNAMINILDRVTSLVIPKDNVSRAFDRSTILLYHVVVALRATSSSYKQPSG